MKGRWMLLTVLFVIGLAGALVVAAKAAPRLIAGHICPAANSTGFGGVRVVGSIPGHPVGKGTTGRLSLRSGLCAIAAGVGDQTTTADTVAATGSAVISGLASVPAGAGAQITFTLASAARVDARLLNIAGRPIRTLCRSKECPTGTNILTWTGQSDEGLRVPNGIYLIEVTARRDDGQQAKALTRVTIRQ